MVEVALHALTLGYPEDLPIVRWLVFRIRLVQMLIFAFIVELFVSLLKCFEDVESGSVGQSDQLLRCAWMRPQMQCI